MDAFWKQYHPWMLIESLSQCSHQVLNAVSDGVFKENVWWRNTILFKKETERLWFGYYKWKPCLFSCSGLKKYFCTFLSSTKRKHPFVRHKIWCTKYCVWKTNELKVYISLKENKWRGFTNSLSSFRVHGNTYLVWDFWKKYYKIHISLPWCWCRHASKVLAKNAYKKDCVAEFPILLALKNYLHVYL